MRDIPFDSKVNNPESFSIFFVEFCGFAALGAALGVAIDAAFTHGYAWMAGPEAQERPVAWARVTSAVLQVAFNSALIFFMWQRVYRPFVEHFQISLTGMAFVGFFFGAQWNVVYALQTIVPFPKLAT